MEKIRQHYLKWTGLLLIATVAVATLTGCPPKKTDNSAPMFLMMGGLTSTRLPASFRMSCDDSAGSKTCESYYDQTLTSCSTGTLKYTRCTCSGTELGTCKITLPPASLGMYKIKVYDATYAGTAQNNCTITESGTWTPGGCTSLP